MRELDLLVIGDCNPDLVLGPDVTPIFGQVETLVDEAALTVGGSGAIVACGAARLGLSTGLASLVGDDPLARAQLDALRERSVDVEDVSVSTTTATGISVILRRGDDRAILTRPGTISKLSIEHIDGEALAAARHVHVSAFFLLSGLRPDVAAILKQAREGGATTSLDTNWDPQESWSEGLEGALEHVDCFLPNAEEALRLTGEATVEAAALALASEVETVAIKLGAEGGLARRGTEVVQHPALDVEVVDTVGAGDSFNAGFLVGRLQGWLLERSLALACACGSLSTRASGGVEAQPTLDEAMQAEAA